MTGRELSESLGELRDAAEIPPAAYTAVRARVMERVAERRRAWPLWMTAVSASACLLWILFPRTAPPAARPAPAAVPAAAAPAPAPAPPPPIVHVRHRRNPKPAAPDQPLQIKMLTDDPDVVIYWIVDKKRRLK